MLKTILMLGIIIGVLSVIGVLIPDQITAEINNAVVYFLSAIWNLDILIDVSVVFGCLQVLANFYFGIAVFWVFYWGINFVRT